MKASLFARESTGGAIAREGFGYQDAYVLQHLPLWLSQSAFSHVVSEAVGDVEVCYFHEDGTTVRTFIEAKGNALALNAFWEEIRQFKKVHETSPGEFPRFILVCRDFNTTTAPLVSKLARLRGVGKSYDAKSPLLSQAREEAVQWGVDKGESRALMEFVVDHVQFVTYADESAQSAFQGELGQHLPTLDLRSSDVAAFREKCVALVTRSSRRPVTRQEIESALLEALGREGSSWMKTPTMLSLAGPVPPFALGVEADFFNGPLRATFTSDDWYRLSVRLAEIGEFIKRSRPRFTVTLSAKQRMSLACLLGYTFSATKGFVLDIEHNDEHFRTDDHVQRPEPFFTLTANRGRGAEGVATIAFPTSASADVGAAIEGRLEHAPALALFSGRAVDGIATLNKAVAEAKAALVDFRSTNRLEVIHLYIKAPSHFAMVLGHRLNAVGRIQLYDWVNGRYVATASLN
jgi:hypothetical protein